MSGVAQGSVLAPILFILFINDVTDSLPPSSTSKLFADDMKSYLTYHNTASLDKFSHLLVAIENWAKLWQLPLSADKCCWMLITNRGVPESSNSFFLLAGTHLKQVRECSDLGVTFSHNLNFSSHISIIVAKGKQRMHLLFKSFSSCNEGALILAFKLYILPIVEYCSPVWSPHTVSDILKIESIQRCFTRKLPSCRFLSYSDRLLKCKLLSLEKRRLHADLVLLYKIINKLVDINLNNSIIFSSNIKNTRGHSKRLLVQPARVNTRLYFFANRVVKVWNILSETTVSSQSLSIFMTNLSNEDLGSHLLLKL